ncbi:glutathione S-transferase family protein [Aestuariibacter sp. AA17]|uniref:Glutathione S-transferase family protein n=1 Tax=Fluctibacter corallii TaxID=2984329 RepID=A0ABT3A9D5_9ALTE|nr:glutathione S-transferase family protein [Aestuariibacter sp. AA17]MCV2885288.1 glutathione S-transferase family protein [Aestuariibacter sp. AA17]
MGLLVDGQWVDKWYETDKNDGKFERQASQFRDEISPDVNAKFPAENHRYHLYVSLACPWAHRTLIYRKLKGLEAIIGLSVVSPDMLEHGWSFGSFPEATGDTLYGHDFLHQLYTSVNDTITTRVTVPVLWDKKEKTIVNNESADIIRMFNSAFNEMTGNRLDFYPKPLHNQIDETNHFVYHNINNGVYKAGFATTQQAYEEAVSALFDALEEIETRLEGQSYLVGDQLTEADWRLFTTLIRFDAVYVGHFKCNIKRIADFPNLSRYVEMLYLHPGVSDTVNMAHIKRHYYYSHAHINPTQVIPIGPELPFIK